MTIRLRIAALLAFMLAFSLVRPSWAQEVTEEVLVEESAEKSLVPEPTAEDVRIFQDHITWLASPFLKGRLPGTPEMAMARDYMEYWFTKVGLKPAWGEQDRSNPLGPFGYRQPFKFGETKKLTAVQLNAHGLDRDFVSGQDIRGMLQGSAEIATANAVFIGYGIAEGSDGYASFPADTDMLKGKIAVMMYFEPMNDQGTSKWSEKRWTRASTSFRKNRSLRDKGCAGIVMVIPPGVKDRRAALDAIRDSSRQMWDCPVIAMSAEAADALIKHNDPEGRDLMTLRKQCDEAPVVFQFKHQLTMNVELESTPKLAENVCGLLPGKGNLADEIIVVGAHIDHLGVGNFGSRARNARGTVHPGADDNASGAAALIMMAERLVKFYSTLPEGANARAVLFAGLDAEEQGLHGARYYTKAPLRPLDKTALMINFDMIGRITKKQLRLDGAKTGTGLEALIDPLLEASPLVIQKGKRVMMASDHAVFYSAKVPILFSIISPFHDEYHTPKDTSTKINALDGARVVELYTEITKKVAQHPEQIKFVRESRQSGRR